MGTKVKAGRWACWMGIVGQGLGGWQRLPAKAGGGSRGWWYPWPTGLQQEFVSVSPIEILSTRVLFQEQHVLLSGSLCPRAEWWSRRLMGRDRGRGYTRRGLLEIWRGHWGRGRSDNRPLRWDGWGEGLTHSLELWTYSFLMEAGLH